MAASMSIKIKVGKTGSQTPFFVDYFILWPNKTQQMLKKNQNDSFDLKPQLCGETLFGACRSLGLGIRKFRIRSFENGKKKLLRKFQSDSIVGE